MRILGNPVNGDQRIISGESGAAAFGAVSEILTDPHLSAMKEKLKINEESILLFISTEGDTDRDNYRKVVWNGAYAKKEM
jgi:diaminopropionate ammonia-lyase